MQGVSAVMSQEPGRAMLGSEKSRNRKHSSESTRPRCNRSRLLAEIWQKKRQQKASSLECLMIRRLRGIVDDEIRAEHWSDLRVAEYHWENHHSIIRCMLLLQL